MPAFKARKPDRFSEAPEPTPLAPPLDDAELAERLASGDRWAQEAFYRKYVQLVWGVSLRLMGNRADAEDVVQDTFAEALRDARQMRDRSVIRGWLMSVAVHQAHRRFRRRRLLRTLGLERGHDATSLDALASRQAGPEQLAELRRLSELLARQPTRRRIAWTLRYIEGCSLDEVAEYCGCSLATAKRDISAAHDEIRRHVDIEEALDG
ncbi:MAG TPA: RNA polymerase sigma factor [Polyangiales bacterium]|nr:RNA polymerase sigma factor [Polyangiales bacterium]